MIVPVSIIIPILNEAKTLSELLHGLEHQTILPQEIIFVDAGSTDGGPELIDAWWIAKGWVGGACRVLRRPGAFPGAGRNAGIEAAQGEWIAFLDGGITPEPNWLRSLFAYATDHHLEGVFGVGRFVGEEPIGRAVCGLSYGQGATLPILPASLFQRNVFKKVGLFSSELRAYEDVRWVNEYLRMYGERRVCADAVVNYRHFPKTIAGALDKWFVYATNAAKAGEVRSDQLRYFLFFGMLVASLAYDLSYGIAVIAAYVVARGVLDPIRRSRSWQWWKGEPLACLTALYLGAALDISKIAGFSWGHITKANQRVSMCA